MPPSRAPLPPEPRANSDAQLPQQLQQLQAFLHGVIWLRLEDLGQQAELDPLLALLTLPVRSDADLQATTARIQALLDFRGPADQTTWVHDHANGS